MFERLDDVAARSRKAAGERRSVLMEALATRLPEWTWTEPKGGLSLWVRLPGTDAVAFSRLAATLGVVVRPGPLASPGWRVPRPHPDRLRLGARPARRRRRAARRRVGGLHPGHPFQPPVAGRQRLTKDTDVRSRCPAGYSPTGLDFPAVADLPAGSPPPPRPSARSARRPRFVLPDDHHDERAGERIEAFLEGPPVRARRTRRSRHLRSEGLRPVRRVVPMDTRTDWDIALRHEDARVARYGRPAAILAVRLRMLTAGAVDHYAARIGGAIRHQARETDRVTRFGPDRFHVLLPETLEAEAIGPRRAGPRGLRRR